MDLLVVAGLHPGGEQPVQLGQVGDLGRVRAVQLDEELGADAAPESFDLALALGLTG